MFVSKYFSARLHHRRSVERNNDIWLQNQISCCAPSQETSSMEIKAFNCSSCIIAVVHCAAGNLLVGDWHEIITMAQCRLCPHRIWRGKWWREKSAGEKSRDWLLAQRYFNYKSTAVTVAYLRQWICKTWVAWRSWWRLQFIFRLGAAAHRRCARRIRRKRCWGAKRNWVASTTQRWNLNVFQHL